MGEEVRSMMRACGRIVTCGAIAITLLVTVRLFRTDISVLEKLQVGLANIAMYALGIVLIGPDWIENGIRIIKTRRFTMKKAIKMAILNLIVIAADILVYSPGFVGLSMGTPLGTASFITGILASGVTVVYGNARILGLLSRDTVKIYRHTDFDDSKDYLETISNLDHTYVHSELDETVSQIERMQKKVGLIDTLLLQFFSKSELSYKNYRAVIDSVSKVFYGNVQNIINRVIIFDPDEYSTMGRMSESSGEHLQVIKDMLANNAEIISRLDNLLIEVSKLTDSRTAVENLPAIKDLEELINNTILYKR